MKGWNYEGTQLGRFEFSSEAIYEHLKWVRVHLKWVRAEK
jgi:hypothetical protein